MFDRKGTETGARLVDFRQRMEGAGMNSGHTLKLLRASVDMIEKDRRIAELEQELADLKRLIGLRRLADDLRQDALNEAADGY
jgi:hypothetical protein